MKSVCSRPGRVVLVGAGPGDPDLLTIKGRRCLERADTVVYDRLVHPQLLDYCRADAERVCVGKKGHSYAVPQDAINRLLVSRARKGQQVVRLKGGDPFIFGRGAEETAYLAEAGIPFEVVPGVSSASAVPAMAGIPVTHRGISSSVAIVTGHGCPDSDHPARWGQLATAVDTLVVFMPLGQLPQIVAELVLHGRGMQTPAALIESGTLPGQRQVVATLATIVGEANRWKIGSPALLVVGEVAALGAAEQRTIGPIGPIGPMPSIEQRDEPPLRSSQR